MRLTFLRRQTLNITSWLAPFTSQSCWLSGITALFPLKRHESCKILTRAFESNRYKPLVTGFSMTNPIALKRQSGPS